MNSIWTKYTLTLPLKLKVNGLKVQIVDCTPRIGLDIFDIPLKLKVGIWKTSSIWNVSL